MSFPLSKTPFLFTEYFLLSRKKLDLVLGYDEGKDPLRMYETKELYVFGSI